MKPPALDAAAATTARRVLADWLQLVRPRVAAMVFLVAFLGAALAGGVGDFGASALAATCVTLVAGAASILNQVLERDSDGRMTRTAARPLPTGRLEVRDALVVATILGTVGTVLTALSFNLLAALLNLASLIVYVAVYTPMKRVSSLSTVVGAVAGAAPPLIGYVAVAGRPGPWAWVLFAIVFAWQFPHFMAIAWLYRQDYARAGIRVLPALAGSAGMAGRQALLYSSALLPVALLPALQGMTGVVYAAAAAGLGLAYLAASIAFARREGTWTARVLLYTSLAYLPLLFASILLDPVARAAVGT